MKWWEKTVEYFFIQKFVPMDAILSPLDGKHELAGDTFLGNHENWIIIEFKVDHLAVKSEEKKFKDYSSAFNELSSRDSHHFIIYGAVNQGEFGLRGRTYFSAEPVNNVEKVLTSGIPKEEFVEYLKILTKQKATSSGQSGVSTGSYSFVAGINKNKEITRCMNLYEFGLDHGLTLEPKLSATQKLAAKRERERGMDFGGPSF